jgi:hypothetical protein
MGGNGDDLIVVGFGYHRRNPKSLRRASDGASCHTIPTHAASTLFELNGRRNNGAQRPPAAGGVAEIFSVACAAFAERASRSVLVCA